MGNNMLKGNQIMVEYDGESESLQDTIDKVAHKHKTRRSRLEIAGVVLSITNSLCLIAMLIYVLLK